MARRAVLGMQRAVADVKKAVKPGYLVPLGGQNICTQSKPDTCFPPNFPSMPAISLEELGVPGIDLDKGAGPQYGVEFQRWRPNPMPPR